MSLLCSLRANISETVLPSKAQEALRLRVVKAVRDGMAQTEAARVFGLAGNYQRLGEPGQAAGLADSARPSSGASPAVTLGSAPGGQGRAHNPQLLPDQMSLPFALWTREAVQQFLSRKFGVAVSVWTVGRYLWRGV